MGEVLYCTHLAHEVGLGNIGLSFITFVAELHELHLPLGRLGLDLLKLSKELGLCLGNNLDMI